MSDTDMTKRNIIDYDLLWDRIKEYARKAGRTAVRPVLLLYYVLLSDDTPRKDKMIIIGSLAYLVLPIDLLDAKRLPIIGWLDEAVSLAVAVQRMSKYITPGMEMRADEVLDRWFPVYTDYVEVSDEEWQKWNSVPMSIDSPSRK